jgi:hypothetical protein
LFSSGPKAIAVSKYVFSAIGLAVLAGVLLWVQNVRTFVAEASVAQGTVVNVVRSGGVYRPVVRFSGAGRQIEFMSGVGTNPPSHARGEKVEVLFQAAAPENARIKSFMSLWSAPLLVGGLGAAFFAVGATSWLLGRVKTRRDEYLKAYGLPIETHFQGVEVNRSLQVNGAHPFRIVTQWQNPETSELHVFRSNNLWFDPTEHIKAKTITVFIEQGNPKKYLVDVSFLPRLAG